MDADRSLLAQVKALDEPTADDQARVRRGLAGILGVAVVTGSGAAAAVTTTVVATSGAEGAAGLATAHAAGLAPGGTLAGEALASGSALGQAAGAAQLGAWAKLGLSAKSILSLKVLVWTGVGVASGTTGWGVLQTMTANPPGSSQVLEAPAQPAVATSSRERGARGEQHPSVVRQQEAGPPGKGRGEDAPVSDLDEVPAASLSSTSRLSSAPALAAPPVGTPPARVEARGTPPSEEEGAPREDAARVTRSRDDGQPKKDSLSRELALIQEVRQALREGIPARALTLVREHEKRFPSGSLTEERLAARALAECQLGRMAQARGTIERFRRTSSRSPLWSRVAAECGLKE